MKYVGQPVMDEDDNYGLVVEYKAFNFSHNTNFPYRIYFPKDGYDDWFTIETTKTSIKRLESWRKRKCQ